MSGRFGKIKLGKIAAKFKALSLKTKAIIARMVPVPVQSVACRAWAYVSNRNALNLLDTIKQSFYGYGYSLYSIQEGNLEKEYKALTKGHFIRLAQNINTDEKTAIYPTEKGLRVGKTSEEKQKWRSMVSKGAWVILSGIIIAVIGGLILHFAVEGLNK